MLNNITKTFLLSVRTISVSQLRYKLTVNKPITWIDLKEWYESGQKQVLWRDQRNTERYIEHKKFVDEHYRSIDDFIRIRYLKWDEGFDESIQRRIAVPGVHSIKEPHLTPNEFPYYLAEGIQHWLVWFDPIPNEVDKVVRDVMNREFHAKRFDRFHFINPPHLRSVTDVFHAHIFVKEIKE